MRVCTHVTATPCLGKKPTERDDNVCIWKGPVSPARAIGGKCRSVLITHFILEKAKGSWLLGFPSVPSLVLDLGGTSLFQRVTNSDLGGGLLAASLSHELRDQLCEISKRPQTFACLGKSTVHLSALLDGAVKDAEAQQQGPQ